MHACTERKAGALLKLDAILIVHVSYEANLMCTVTDGYPNLDDAAGSGSLEMPVPPWSLSAALTAAGTVLKMAKMSPEQSGIPLISQDNGRAAETAGSVSVTIGTAVSTEKAMLSEAALDVDNSSVSTHHKRHGMKVTFRVQDASMTVGTHRRCR